MHEDLKHYFDKTHPKNLAKTSLILKNLKNFKNPKSYVTKCEIHDEERD